MKYFALSEADDVARAVDHGVDALPVRMLRQDGGCCHVDVHTLYTRLDSGFDVTQMTPRVSQNLRLQSETSNALRIGHGLFARNRIHSLDVIDTQLVQLLRDVHALFGSEVTRRKLLTLAQRRVHNPLEDEQLGQGRQYQARAGGQGWSKSRVGGRAKR